MTDTEKNLPTEASEPGPEAHLSLIEVTEVLIFITTASPFYVLLDTLPAVAP